MEREGRGEKKGSIPSRVICSFGAFKSGSFLPPATLALRSSITGSNFSFPQNFAFCHARFTPRRERKRPTETPGTAFTLPEEPREEGGSIFSKKVEFFFIHLFKPFRFRNVWKRNTWLATRLAIKLPDQIWHIMEGISSSVFGKLHLVLRCPSAGNAISQLFGPFGSSYVTCIIFLVGHFLPQKICQTHQIQALGGPICQKFVTLMN